MYLKRWKRGATFLVALFIMFSLGLYQDGQLFSWGPGFFGFLKFFADAALGLPYIIGKMAGWGSADIRLYGYEYGNAYLYTAGLLNMLLIVDVFDIAVGRKK